MIVFNLITNSNLCAHATEIALQLMNPVVSGLKDSFEFIPLAHKFWEFGLVELYRQYKTAFQGK
jgi:hypothetical protein